MFLPFWVEGREGNLYDPYTQLIPLTFTGSLYHALTAADVPLHG